MASADDTPTSVTINILGTNDVPTISGTSTGSVTEDTHLANFIASFGTASVYSVGSPTYVVVADVNGDGNADIVTPDYYSHVVP